MIELLSFQQLFILGRGTGKMFQSKLQRNLSYLVFAVYLVLLAWLVLFKFETNLSRMEHIRGINLIPFYYDTEVSLMLHAKEVSYNVLIFVPLGVYVCMFRPKWSMVKKLLPGFALSLLFEALQYIFAIGATDITDLITNTLGGALGIALFLLLQRLFKKRCATVVNVIGGTVEVLGLFLLGILIVSNL